MDAGAEGFEEGELHGCEGEVAGDEGGVAAPEVGRVVAELVVGETCGAGVEGARFTLCLVGLGLGGR